MSATIEELYPQVTDAILRAESHDSEGAMLWERVERLERQIQGLLPEGSLEHQIAVRGTVAAKQRATFLRHADEEQLEVKSGLKPRCEAPIRCEQECTCGATLVVEATRSKKSPYSWNSPREITCECGRSYGVKLSFYTSQPGDPPKSMGRIELLDRSGR